MFYMGPGSDWNPETDGEPICICEMEETLRQEEAYEQQVLTESKAPATGEPAMVEVLGTVAMMLILIIAIAGTRLKEGTTWE